jgi:hypothetical protein
MSDEKKDTHKIRRVYCATYSTLTSLFVLSFCDCELRVRGLHDDDERPECISIVPCTVWIAM